MATIGDQELALLRWITERGPTTLRDAAEGYGAEAGLARSTVLTMMERLRKKGRLKRKRVEGVFRYESSVSADDLLTGAVRSFVEKTLGGSVSPVVAYLADTEEVSEEELAQLEALVAKLQSSRKGG
jgi:predicted transcriptional regulator